MLTGLNVGLFENGPHNGSKMGVHESPIVIAAFETRNKKGLEKRNVVFAAGSPVSVRVDGEE